MRCRGRECDCSKPQEGVDRRDFLKTVAAGAAAATLSPTHVNGATDGKPYWAIHQLPAEKLAQWKKSVFDKTPRRVYTPKKNPDARLPLGGIGTGNCYLGADGRLTGWSVTNSMGEQEVGEPFFAIRTERSPGRLAMLGGEKGTRRVVAALTTRPPEGLAGVEDIRMIGEYPVAELHYRLEKLPVAVKLTAHTPFIPLDSRQSGFPAAVFQFHIRNKTHRKVRVALLAAVPNFVGLANESAQGLRHPNYGGNFNEFARAGDWRLIRLRAVTGEAASCEQPVHLFVASADRNFDRAWQQATKYEKPEKVTVARANASGAIAKQVGAVGQEARVVWLENPADVGADFLEGLQLAARDGATVAVSGDDPPLLRRMIGITGIEKKGLPDIVFEDFESGYDKWTVEGEAFGTAPARGTLPSQQPVSGFQGKGLANSFRDGDNTRGKLTSREFAVERPLIRFLIGGGSDPKRTCMNLVVDGKVARSASGRDLERLDWRFWNVRELMGKRAHLEIIDNATGPWGHVNVDQIVFTENLVDDSVIAALRELLPATFSDIGYHREPLEVRLKEALPAVGMNEALFEGWTEYKDLKLAEGSEVVLRSATGAPLIVRRPIGKGAVCLVCARLLPNQWSAGRRTRALSLLAGLAGVRMKPCHGLPAAMQTFGELTLSTPAAGGAVLGWDSPKDLLGAFAAGAVVEPKEGSQSLPTAPGVTQGAALIAEIELKGRGEATIPFLLTWHFPNDTFSRNGERIGHYYSTTWPDAPAVQKDLARNLEKLDGLTERFRRTFYDSTLPYWLLDCITSQISTIRNQGVCFWMEDGVFAGWEGNWYCCQPTCTHVWGYEQTLAHVFPDLERIMRYVDYKRQLTPNGGINNRVDIPIPAKPSGERPFTDGHASCILKAYRETLLCPDGKWFSQYWPDIKKGVEYLIARDGNPPDGIIDDEQWHTYDVAAYGPNSFLGTYYLAALRAGEEMALRAGEKETAARWHSVFQSGSNRLVELCWNGEYFQQTLPDYLKRQHQWGPGCLADQLIGQWWAHQLGLGYLLPKEYVRVALEAIFKYNWLSDMRAWSHTQRWFADGDDKGLLCCTWPRGGRPNQPVLYCDEVWTGVEYQVAAHMIYEGMAEEGFCIVKGARERYDGRAKTRYDRNPWDEKECGGHYARAMSSWSLLTALSGFQHDATRGQIAFAPVITPENFKSFFAGGEGWGSFAQIRKGKRQKNEIGVVYGQLRVGVVRLGVPDDARGVRATVSVASERVTAKVSTGRGQAVLSFAKPVTIPGGQTLAVELEWA